MTTPGLSGSQLSDALAELRQGDVVMCTRMPVVTGDGVVDWITTPEGAVIVTQTCDLVRPSPPYAALAPLIRLTEEQARLARDGRQSQFIPVAWAGSDLFADMRQVVSLEKTYLAHMTRAYGREPDGEVGRFGKLVGRRYSRFAFPDELVFWLEPLRKVAQQKSSQPGSAEGRRFHDDVSELRIEPNSSWQTPPYAFTLVIVLKDGVLPEFPGGLLPAMPGDLEKWLRPKGDLRVANEIAVELENALDPVWKYWLWQALGEAWAGKCRPSQTNLDKLDDAMRNRVRAAVLEQEIGFDVTSEDGYTLRRYKMSEILDLDFLSPPTPLASVAPPRTDAVVREPDQPGWLRWLRRKIIALRARSGRR